MTHSGGRPHAVGDRGQRYEVTFWDPDLNQRRVFGWTDSETAVAAMHRSIELHPTMTLPETRDRFAKDHTMPTDTNLQIHIHDMCETHQYLLVHQAKYSKSDPWRALIVAAQMTLFQAATCDPKTHQKIGNDITKVTTLGCLACYKPDAFGEVVEAAKSHDIGQIKALGERWIREAQR